MAEHRMTAAMMIAALQKLKPDAPVLINIKQANKAYGVVQLPVFSTLHHSSYETWVDGSYGGATITVHLPEKAFISRLPKNY